MSNNSRNNILKKIRLALTHSTPIPFPQSEGGASVVQPLQQDIVIEFAEQFTNLQGQFNFCTNAAELHQNFNLLYKQNEWTKVYCEEEQWKSMLEERIWTDDIVTCDAAITSCELLVARTGSIVLSSKNSGRITSVYAPVHVCIAFTSQLVYDVKDALVKLNEKYKGDLPSFITLATGPSRTADIEKTLVVGVHGPKEVYLFLVDDLEIAS